MRLLFMGSSPFAVPSLQALAQHHDIAAVYCRAPQKAKRGQRVQMTPVQAAAQALGLSVCCPHSLKAHAVQQEFADYGAQLAIVVAYGLILPAPILAAPAWGCLNLHASLLPRWRGAAPIARAIEAGDTETGISLMHIGPGLDDGPVYAQHAVPIADADTCGSLSERLSALAAQLCVAFLHTHANGLPEPVPQSHADACYADKIQKHEAHIDWAKPAPQIVRKIHALAPSPGAWFAHNGVRVRVLAAHAVAGDGAAGQVLRETGVIACQRGAVQLLQVQRAGKQALPIAEFLRGQALKPGMQLE